MNKSNLELFKQALNEAVSNKFDKMAADCTEEIVFSEMHKRAMQAIIHGKADTAKSGSLRIKRIIAILVAAALLLTSCGIIFRNKIREIFEEFYVRLTYECDEETSKIIEDVYTLSYLPEGYVLEKEKIEALRIKYTYYNEARQVLYFEQLTLTQSGYYIDSESGYSKIEEIEEYEIYYRLADKFHCYVWSDEKYSMKIKADAKISNEEIIKIIDGITTK